MRDAECVVRSFKNKNIMIGTLGSIGVGLVNNAISQANVEDQRLYNERMWHMQNAYNSPAAMADRMRAAGLNPYLMTGAEPAGSINSSPPAQTLPIENPLYSLKTIAEIENINASTGRTESEAEKVLKEISLLDIAYERGLIEKDDYERKVKAYWDAYDDKSEFELDRELTEGEITNTTADTGVKESQTRLNDSLVSLNTAKKEYQDILNSHADAQQKAEIKQKLASAQNSYAQALASEMQAKYVETLENNATQQEARNAALHVYELAIKQYDSDIRYQESVTKHMEAKRAELKTNNPFTEGDGIEDLLPWLHYNLFGENGIF